MDSQPAPSPSAVHEILKRKRKVREHKACYPCRKRKVRCDSQVPCKTCVERNHPDLCTFNPPSKRRDSSATHVDNGRRTSQDSSMSIRHDDWERVCSRLQFMEKNLSELKDDIRHINQAPAVSSPASKKESASPTGALDVPPLQRQDSSQARSMDLNEHSHLTGEDVYIGGGSIPALVRSLANNGNKAFDIFGDNMLPLFGLDNESATYPFISLWGYQGTAVRINELRKLIPGENECLTTFQQYRDGSYANYPAIADIDKFEIQLRTFLRNRSLNASRSESQGPMEQNDQMDGMSLRWTGLLFAVLASGVQYSNFPKKDRELMSQVYGCCSFECLRMVNYLSNACIEVVQTFLILGNILTSGMNAGASWVLLGMTLRIARTLGMHTASKRATRSPTEVAKAKTWWMALWQDSVLCIGYDRATSATLAECPYPPSDSRLNAERGGLSYADCMWRITRIGLLTVQNRVSRQTMGVRLNTCSELRDDVVKTQTAAADHLRDVRKCASVHEQAEYWTFYLQASYMISELCRPGVNPGTSENEKSTHLRRLCIENLLKTVEAFNGLALAFPLHTRTWSIKHRALSAALLLGILGEPLRNQQAQALVKQFIRLVREMAATMDGGELSPPVLRSIHALRKLSGVEGNTPGMPNETTQQLPATAPQIPMAPLNTSSTAPIEPALSAPVTANGTPDMSSLNSLQIPPEIDQSTLFQSPFQNFDDDSSPFTLMDSIIWGYGSDGNLQGSDMLASGVERSTRSAPSPPSIRNPFGAPEVSSGVTTGYGGSRSL